MFKRRNRGDITNVKIALFALKKKKKVLEFKPVRDRKKIKLYKAKAVR